MSAVLLERVKDHIAHLLPGIRSAFTAGTMPI